MELKIRDLSFRITKATIWAGLADPYCYLTSKSIQDFNLSWSLDIETEQMEIKDEIWQPHVLRESLKFPIKRWMDLEGQEIGWDVPHDPDTNEANGSFYVWYHGDINRARVRFSDRQGLSFHLHWSGACNVDWDDEYAEDVSFSIETRASFDSLRVSASEIDTDETIRQRLSHFLDPNDFIQQPIKMIGWKYPSGVAMAEGIFVPRV